MESLSPMKAIRKFCIDCSGGSFSEVKECPCKDCPLYFFRTGRKENGKKREYTPEQRAAMAERMRKMRTGA